MKPAYIVALLVLVAAVSSSGAAEDTTAIGLLVGEAVSREVSDGVAAALDRPGVTGKCELRLYLSTDVREGHVDAQLLADLDILIVDVMYRELAAFALEHSDFERTKVYAVRSGTGDTKPIIDDPKVKAYYAPVSKRNIENLILFLLNRDRGYQVAYKEPFSIPSQGFFHPRADRIFATYGEYIEWYKRVGIHKKEGFRVGVADYATYAVPGNCGPVISSLILALEDAGINTLPVFGHPSRPETLFLDEEGKPLVDIVCGLCFKMGQTATEETRSDFARLGAPVLNAARLWTGTIDEWKRSNQGLGTTEISWQICVPEFNGLIEPAVLGGKVPVSDERSGKTVYRCEPIRENIDFLVARVKAWRNLQVRPNRNKKVAILYWNHTPGKQNIGASYLNTFRSIERILARMQHEGYAVEGTLPSEEQVKEMVLRSGRNIGSWAPGELDDLLNSRQVVRIPVARYREWYAALDGEYRRNVEGQWGRPEDSDIMVKDGDIVIPCVNLGNVILVPQPSRGFGDDAAKLYHDPTIWPTHQYTAFYLWLKREFHVDAIISLGKHGTHEWLPGKQAGLSQACPPEVLIRDIPNIYPYIVDNIGEGIQAKRRGRGVIIDHLIPVLTEAGAYEEYRSLGALIDEYNDAVSRSAELATEKLKRIKTLVKQLGLDRDLLLDKIDEGTVGTIEHYLLELQETAVPHGMHTFGVSPGGAALDELTDLIHGRNPALDQSDIKAKLELCHLEMDHLMAALEGKYVPSGEGNDPLRNPDALPTGRNFYGFDPARVPSKDACALGKAAADEMIRKYVDEHGAYPEKIALILWATEVHRNEGSQVGTALFLLGMKPKWDRNGKVLGVEPIPGSLLGRPRIDVHLQASGLFRDSFPNVMALLDEAVRQASRLQDVENFIARHSARIKSYLKEKGYSEDDAAALSHTRVFSEAPGSYVTKVQELVPNSGLWESDEEIADVFIHHTSYAYGKRVWGVALKSVYTKSLEDVDVTMHTLSSSVYGVMDNDDVFGYLGGMALAVKRAKGEYPDVVVSDQRNPMKAHIENIERMIGRELRSRYLNPKWIEGMKRENYAGAREMAKFTEYMWGWQVTTPFAVDAAKWEQTYQVYVQDKYDLDLEAFFDKNNPWAKQSISARMLEAIRKQYWDAPEETRKDLARTYAVSVIEKGLACCDHTCNNPALNQMVVNIISVPGLLSPELVNQFKAVLSKAAGAELDAAVQKRQGLRQELSEITRELRAEEKTVKADAREKDHIEGYEIVEENVQEDSRIVSSGAAWATIAVVLIVLGLLGFGWYRKQ